MQKTANRARVGSPDMPAFLRVVANCALCCGTLLARCVNCRPVVALHARKGMLHRQALGQGVRATSRKPFRSSHSRTALQPRAMASSAAPSPVRALHWVFKIGDRTATHKFLSEQLGMEVLRHEEVRSTRFICLSIPASKPASIAAQRLVAWRNFALQNLRRWFIACCNALYARSRPVNRNTNMYLAWC